MTRGPKLATATSSCATPDEQAKQGESDLGGKDAAWRQCQVQRFKTSALAPRVEDGGIMVASPFSGS